MKDHRVTVRFSPELRQRLKETARRSKLRESDLIRGAVERHLKAEENALTAYERVANAGLIGMVKSAPRDLSTNRKHFHGFGES